MIQLTSLFSENKDAPNLVLIPGGPGLSSLTLRSFDVLQRSFHLHYIDFPGTNGNPYTKDRTFGELSRELLKITNSLPGKTFVLGHSFGGFFASAVAYGIDASGLICIATPFTKKSLQCASENYENKKSNALIQAEKIWSDNPSDLTYTKYLAEYNDLYFSPHTLDMGRKMLLEDPASSAFSIANRSDASKAESLLECVCCLPIKKLFISGKNDALLNLKDLEVDAEKGAFNFKVVENANHFVMFDQPEIVAGLIEEFCDIKKGVV